jgi:hypothetical protein
MSFSYINWHAPAAAAKSCVGSSGQHMKLRRRRRRRRRRNR